MSQGQEGKPPWQAPATTGLKAFVQTAEGFLESAGAIQRGPEGGKHLAPLSLRAPGQGGLCQSHRGLPVADRVGNYHTEPGHAVGLRGIGHAHRDAAILLATYPDIAVDIVVQVYRKFTAAVYVRSHLALSLPDRERVDLVYSHDMPFSLSDC